MESHPAADLFPLLSETELDELATDIQKNGLLQPVLMYQGQVLDGRNRILACEKVGIEPGRVEYTGDDPVGVVVSLNIRRRNLTRAQKRDLIAKLLKMQPEKPDLTIAKAVQASPTTVGTIRAELEENGDVSNLETRTDSTGRQQPARKPRQPKQQPKQPKPAKGGSQKRYVKVDDSFMPTISLEMKKYPPQYVGRAIVTIDREYAQLLAKAIAESYDTPVTLRQLYYRLVAAELIRNNRSTYGYLSDQTAELRRQGLFPDFIDRNSSIYRELWFENVDEALEQLRGWYRRDRTDYQEWSVYLGVEKAGLVEQLRAWFSDRGIPILALGGYASQTYVNQIARNVAGWGRPGVLVYAGDFDPSGEDIFRDFVERTDCFDKVEHIALNRDQIEQYDLPPALGKETDTRAAQFIAKYGELIQVEVDALPPDELRGLYETALSQYWDDDAYQQVLNEESEEREELASL